MVIDSRTMADQLSATDWLDQGLKTLAKSGFTALKADPLAKTLGVSRGSFYWHFADVGAFHAAVLERWREIAAERIIVDIEAQATAETAVPYLLRRAFGGNPALEIAVRSWATHDGGARKAVQAIDQRRLSYIEQMLRRAGVPLDTARARAQILYWAFLGFVVSDKPLPRRQRDEVIDELIRIASSRA